MPLITKYRPQDFDQFIGNERVVQSLQSLLEKDPADFPPVVLFQGEAGCGKTTAARICAQKLGCKGMDLKEINIGDFTGIDSSRDLVKSTYLAPMQGDRKAYILDEVGMQTKQAQGALLKVFEEPPTGVNFFLATTDPQKLTKAIKSRCTIFQVSPVDEKDIKKLITMVVRAEGKKLDKDAKKVIAEQCLGHPRDALSILETVIDLPAEDQERVALIEAEKQNAIIDLCRAMISLKSWKDIASILAGLKKEEPEGIRRMIMSYCTTILLKEDNLQAYIIMDEFNDMRYDLGFPGAVRACYASYDRILEDKED